MYVAPLSLGLSGTHGCSVPPLLDAPSGFQRVIKLTGTFDWLVVEGPERRGNVETGSAGLRKGVASLGLGHSTCRGYFDGNPHFGGLCVKYCAHNSIVCKTIRFNMDLLDQWCELRDTLWLRQISGRPGGRANDCCYHESGLQCFGRHFRKGHPLASTLARWKPAAWQRCWLVTSRGHECMRLRRGVLVRNPTPLSLPRTAKYDCAADFGGTKSPCNNLKGL